MSEADERAGLVFAALADPTRRQLVRLLGDGTAVTASGLAEQLPISRQAVAKHLAILAGAGLVASRREGRETRFVFTPRPMHDAVGWLASAGAPWDARLERLERVLRERAPR